MSSFIEIIQKLSSLMAVPLWETIYMVSLSTIFSVIGGLPLGILAAVTEKNHICENEVVNKILNVIINIARSLPFIILMIAVFPLTKLIVGKRIGTTAAIVPLTIAAIPFVARLIEGYVKELNQGIIEAAESMGANRIQIIIQVIIPEILPSIVLGITLTIINLIGYSAMAGAIGGGGLGNLAIRYGYQGFQEDVMIGTIIVLVILVQLIQSIGNLIYKKMIR